MSTRENKVIKACLSLHKDNDSKLNTINKVEQCARVAKDIVLDEGIADELKSMLDEVLLPLKSSHEQCKELYPSLTANCNHYVEASGRTSKR